MYITICVREVSLFPCFLNNSDRLDDQPRQNSVKWKFHIAQITHRPRKCITAPRQKKLVLISLVSLCPDLSPPPRPTPVAKACGQGVHLRRRLGVGSGVGLGFWISWNLKGAVARSPEGSRLLVPERSSREESPLLGLPGEGG